MDKRQSSVDARRVNRPVLDANFADSILSPIGIQITLLMALIAACFWQATLLVTLPGTAILLIIFGDRPFRMPLRMPTDVGGIDITTEREGFKGYKGIGGVFRFVTRTRHYGKAEGILCLGYARGKQLAHELWLNLDDALRHIQLMATTGSGKTEGILAICLNALCWGRGFCLSDGKAENNLAFAIWSLARRFGREDDVLILNFLTGGESKLKRLVKGDKSRPQTNSINLFGQATETFIIQLMESLLPVSSTGEDGWQDKAKAMIGALIYALCYKRERDGLQLSQNVIQAHLPLRKIAALYQEAIKNNWHEEGYKPLESYLNALAGFDMNLINKPSEWSQGVFDQHGFLIQQFTRMLSMFNDIYGHVFPKGAGDISFRDTLHNDRILAVLIPALELSNSEASTLGKLYISGLRMTISQDLGHHLEGKRKDVLIAKRYAGKFPYAIIFDELGAYFASGMDKLASQMRSLLYMLMTSGQDAQAMKRKANGEFDSVNANQRTKWFMALEDPLDTFDIIRAAAGKGYYSELSSVERRSGAVSSTYDDADSMQIRERDNIEFTELKALKKGEGVIVLEDAVVRSAALYIPDDEKLSSELPMRINRFIEVKKPTFEALCGFLPSLARKRPVSQTNVDSILRRFNATALDSEEGMLKARLYDKTLHQLCQLTCDLDNRADVSYSPAERGVLLFEAARRAIKKTNATYHTRAEPKEVTLSRKALNAVNEEASHANP
ncbi:F-type conjugative transfer protein TrbC [Yersinia pseudotuberculosis]|uniref:TrbC protein n=1 Tax=Yersinia pseudotuberculosis TaxID=633 RepID=B7UF08_YERPU|nr:F-type conjugative transfer protein TrbC [Yersinia pseudotuberculosis]MBO1551394.1 conjugal transfer protein TrbC [Yersinia pseudotuberculosis]MBO1562470.1 conjugal transfer protein TrbC [Yersinia pseudotuberculosis]MBO1571447.1 conjugal transfer protein TrbC [Yersinia pseudotuberculosis]MBO1586399.1 conjugal transfer protein TrbC [Yersinia pseudotuberculosis]MBO1631774.1 conjugal transfer protein TrbC [Yersinia pseudotuberculosis]